MATKEEILDAIAGMTVLELSELLSDFEEKFGVTAAAPGAQSPPEKPAPPRVEPENYASMCANRAREAKQRNPKLLARPSSEESARRPGRRCWRCRLNLEPL